MDMFTEPVTTTSTEAPELSVAEAPGSLKPFLSQTPIFTSPLIVTTGFPQTFTPLTVPSLPARISGFDVLPENVLPEAVTTASFLTQIPRVLSVIVLFSTVTANVDPPSLPLPRRKPLSNPLTTLSLMVML